MKSQFTNKQALAALKYLVPILAKYPFRWCISGGFACHVYGVSRPIEEIHIDLEVDKDDPRFADFLREVRPFTTLPFQIWVDQNYDHYVMEVTVDHCILSICPTKNLHMFDRGTGKTKLFYKNGIPQPERVVFEGLTLPLLPKQWVIKMKQALVKKRARDRSDIVAMERLRDVGNR